MICSHAYTRPFSSDMRVCMDCGELVQKRSGDTGPLVMPPVVYGLDRRRWAAINPWPLMPFEIAEKYGWYISVIGIDDYLVMPVIKKGKPVFYSARRLTDNGGPKYRKPAGVSQHIWISGAYKELLLVGEGLADGAYLSQIAPAAALLGSHAQLPDVPIITVLDGDDKGIEAAFDILQEQKRKGFVESKGVILPDRADPTDIRLPRLRKIIRQQTGVKL